MTKVIFKYDINNRPIAEVILQNGEHKKRFFLLIDSGADSTAIPQEVGEALKLEPARSKEIEQLTGLGGEVNYVKRPIRMEIYDYNFPIEVNWLFDTPDVPPILGRDVFERFNVLFRQNPHKQIIFDSNKK